MNIIQLTDTQTILNFVEHADYNKTSYLYKLPQEHAHINQMLEQAIDNPGVFALVEDDDIKAVLFAFTYDTQRFKVIGPIVQTGYTLSIEDQDALFKHMYQAQPPEANFNFSYEAQTQTYAREMKALDVAYNFTDYYLEAYPEQSEALASSHPTITEYHKAYFRAFRKLHDKAFKRAEMSAEDIVDALDEYNRLFIYMSEGLLKGYVYLQVNPNNRIAEIKYFTSHRDYRFKGIAFGLLKYVLHFAFTHYELKKVYFKIRSKNSKLVERFNELGFVVNNEYKKFKFVANNLQ